MKVLIDTNVILDALMKRTPWVGAAEAILMAVAEEKVTGYITASTFTDLYYLLQKRLQNKELTKQTLLDLITVVDVLDVTGTDCERASDLPMTDYEDALLAYCAKRHRVGRIITRNVKHFAGSPIIAIEPGDFLETL